MSKRFEPEARCRVRQAPSQIKLNFSNFNDIYIQSAKLNGQDWNKCWISHGQLAEGGILELEMGKQPNENLETINEILKLNR